MNGKVRIITAIIITVISGLLLAIFVAVIKTVRHDHDSVSRLEWRMDSCCPLKSKPTPPQEDE
jgi:hypothetical protein